MPSEQRNITIDFWRGLVLVAILVDHIPGNLLDTATPRNFGFSDSAEAFVFLSGLSVGVAYYSKVLQSDLVGVVRRCAARAWRIYGFHIGLSACAVAIFAGAYAIDALPDLIQADGRSWIFHKPLRGMVGVLLLSQQLGYFNILPLYVVLMLWAPFVLGLARVSIALVLAVSIGFYAAARLGGLALPYWPEPGTWFLNPFAWQLIFTLGVIAGIVRQPVPTSAIGLFGAMAAVVAAAVIVTDGLGMLPGLRDAAFQRLDILKQNLGLVRLLHFLALAYLAARLPFVLRLAQTHGGRELRRLGRHSLAVFALGSVLCALGQAVMQLAVAASNDDDAIIIGISYTLVSVGGLFVLARHLERGRPGAAAGFDRRALRPSPTEAPARDGDPTMAFHLRLETAGTEPPRRAVAPRRLRQLGTAFGLAAAALVVLVIGDDVLSGTRYSSWIVSDAVSAVLGLLHR